MNSDPKISVYYENSFKLLKGTVRLISSDLLFTEVHPRFTTVPIKYLTENSVYKSLKCCVNIAIPLDIEQLANKVFTNSKEDMYCNP